MIRTVEMQLFKPSDSSDAHFLRMENLLGVGVGTPILDSTGRLTSLRSFAV